MVPFSKKTDYFLFQAKSICPRRGQMAGLLSILEMVSDGVLLVREGSLVEYANHASENLLALHRQHIIGTLHHLLSLFIFWYLKGQNIYSLIGKENATRFREALVKSTAEYEQKLTLRVKNCLEALEFRLRQADDPTLHFCVFKSTRSYWLEVADSKLSLVMNAVEVLPDSTDFNLLWFSEYLYKMSKNPKLTKQILYSGSVADHGELSEADRLW